MKRKMISYVALAVFLLLIASGFFVYTTYFRSGFSPINNGKINSASLYQAVMVTYTDSSTSWKYPTSRTALSPLVVIDTDPVKEVRSIYCCVYINIRTSQNLTKAEFTASSKVSLYSTSKTLIQDLGSWQPMTYSISNPANNTDILVISATITAADFEGLYANWNLIPRIKYYYVVTVKDISVQATYSNGTQTSIGFEGVQGMENQLWWSFIRPPSGMPFAITGIDMEWIWK